MENSDNIIHEKREKTAPISKDELLLWCSEDAELRRTKLENVAPSILTSQAAIELMRKAISHADVIHAKAKKSAPTLKDELLLWCSEANELKKISLEDLIGLISKSK